MAEERDYKRRRQSYKGGKTGSVKRSYTEVSSENMGSLYVLVLVYFSMSIIIIIKFIYETLNKIVLKTMI